MTVVPQARFTNFLGAVSASYVLRIDISSGGDDYVSRGFSILNMDASIVVTVSFDNSTDHIELDPADSNSVTLDNFTPPNGTIYIKSASGTPRVQAMVWG